MNSPIQSRENDKVLPKTVTETTPEPAPAAISSNGKKPHGNTLNTHAIRGGEKSQLTFRAATKGEGSMIGLVNKWRRTLDAELIAKFGQISAYQDARLIAACHWDLCRKRRCNLARAAKTEMERIEHDEMAAANCDKRDKCLAEAGLGKPGKPVESDPFAALDALDAEEALQSDETTSDTMDTTERDSRAANIE